MRPCFIVLTLVLFLCALALAAEPLATFTCQERVCRDWGRTLVTYPVTFKLGQVHADRVRLVDANGQEQPCQFSRVVKHRDGSIATARLSFFAELPKGGSYRFDLLPGKPAKVPGVQAITRGGMITLDNGITAIRLPAGKKTYKTPLALVFGHQPMQSPAALEKAGLAFGPIAGIRLADGRWVEGSYFATEPLAAVLSRLHVSVPNELAGLYREEPPTAAEIAAARQAAPTVTGYAAEVTEEGPLFTEARIRFTFSNGCYYLLTARVLPGDPAIRLDEISDMAGNAPPDAPIYVEMAMAAPGANGWRPDAAFLYNTRRQEHCTPLEEALKAQGITPKLASAPITYDKDENAITDVTQHYPWNLAAHLVGLVETAQLRKDKAAPFLAIVPMHAGSWRGGNFCFPPKPQIYQQLVAYADGDLLMRWKVRAQPHSQNVLHTGEYDPDFGLEGTRRLWCLVAGPFQYYDTLVPFRAYEGYINLDNYKDWTLAWSDDTRAALQLPPPAKVPNTGPIWKMHNVLGGADGYPWFTHFLQGVDCGWAVDLRAKLADPNVSVEEKGRIRTELAAFCEFVSEPDFNTRASMTHQGNPNMPINRFMALPFAAALIPDHPKAKRWLDVSAEYIRYKLGMNVSPGGAWSELVTYYYASLPMLANGSLVLNETNRLDETTRKLTLLPIDFTLKLISPPDPRVGYRMVPGFGHEGVMSNIGRPAGAHWLTGAALESGHDPDKAAVYAWAWEQAGRQGEEKRTNPFDVGFEKRTIPAYGPLAKQVKLEAIRQALRSDWLPGFGAVLRAHAGEEGETYLGYRQGYMASHSDANQGDFTLFAKGAPLVPISLFGYAIWNYPPYSKINQEFGWHSRVRFGDMRDNGGWPGGGPVSGVDRHFFSDSVDYLHGIGDYGSQRWTRQILFCKGQQANSPDYFVFRDSFSLLDALATTMVKPDFTAPVKAGELQQKWWYLRTLGHTDQVGASKSGLTYTSEYGPKLDVRFLQPASVAITSREASSGAKTFTGTEETITVNAAGPIPAGQDVLVVLYPRGKDEAAPAYEALGDGAAKITTSESTDYVFLNRERTTWQQGDITFTGTAGAVRVYPNEVHLVVAEGAGLISYKGYMLKADKPATKVIPLAELAKKATVEIPADPVTLTFALDEKAGPITQVTPVVRKQTLPNGVAYEFNSRSTFSFTRDGVTFTGLRGGIVVDNKAQTVRVVMLAGEKIGCSNLRADVASGPYDVTFYPDHIAAVTEGPARFIHLSMPTGLTQLPAITMDGLTYAPGTGNEMLIIPLFDGHHTFTVGNLPQPGVFRRWEFWP